MRVLLDTIVFVRTLCSERKGRVGTLNLNRHRTGTMIAKVILVWGVAMVNGPSES